MSYPQKVAKKLASTFFTRDSEDLVSATILRLDVSRKRKKSNQLLGLLETLKSLWPNFFPVLIVGGDFFVAETKLYSIIVTFKNRVFLEKRLTSKLIYWL